MEIPKAFVGTILPLNVQLADIAGDPHVQHTPTDPQGMRNKRWASVSLSASHGADADRFQCRATQFASVIYAGSESLLTLHVKTNVYKAVDDLARTAIAATEESRGNRG